MGNVCRWPKHIRETVATLRHPRNVRKQPVIKGPKQLRVSTGGEEGAVYHLTLQKVIPVNKGLRWLEVDEEQLQSEFRISKSWRSRAINSGTLEELVDNLLTASGDSSYLNVFLSTHKDFSSVKEVLGLLFDRYGNLEEQRNNNCSVTKPEFKSPPQVCPAPVYKKQNGEACVIRVSMEGSEGNVYKSLIVTTEDKTKAIIQKAIDKFCIADEADMLELVQLLPGDKELILPDNSNTYYAMKSAAGFNFILRVKPTPLVPGWRPLPTFAF